MPPYASLAFGEAIPAIDRKKADLQALKFAISLHRDQVLGTDVEYAGEYALRRAQEYGKYWRTGLKSFTSWMESLGDMDHWGQPRWHSNVQGFLERNRRTAIRYLKAMQKRHSKTGEAHLENAIREYTAIVGELVEFDTSREAALSVQGRSRMISSIERIAKLESQAVAELEKTVEAFDSS